jgi:hypothetical protein
MPTQTMTWMITLLVTVGVGIAPTFAAKTTACAKSVAMCQDTAMSCVIHAPCSGWIAGWTSTTTELETEGGQLSGMISIGVPSCRDCTRRNMLLGVARLLTMFNDKAA